LSDADVAAVAAGLGAELADEVGREAEDKGRETAGAGEGAAGRKSGGPAAAGARRRDGGEVGFRAALEWGKSPSAAAPCDGHF